MKTQCWIYLILVVFTLNANTLFAQEDMSTEKLSIGLGVALGKELFSIYELDGNVSLPDFPSFYVPIQLSKSFRIEPEIGYFRYSIENDLEESSAVLVLGCGLFYTHWHGKANIYFGGRFELYRYSSQVADYDLEWNGDSYDWIQTAGHDYTTSNWVLSPAIGSEYFICPNKLSLGGEIQLNYTIVGDLKVDGESVDEDYTEHLLKTKTLFFIRWFF